MAETLNYALKRTTQPQAEPLSLAEAKLFLRVDGSAEDGLIMDMMVAVREAAEDYLHKSLVTQNWTMALEGYAPSRVVLPKGPVQSISEVRTRDRNGNEAVVDASLYHLSDVENAIHFESAIIAHEVKVTYVCGYGDAQDVPYAVRQGMLAHLVALYEDRLGGMPLPAATVALYKPHRYVRV
ncbi:MAG: phage head-tail connector protein [Alphaproteobacteria bacterium]|nr:phage head-tail connector protein [Alphaproteobacteria bacterium]